MNSDKAKRISFARTGFYIIMIFLSLSACTNKTVQTGQSTQNTQSTQPSQSAQITIVEPETDVVGYEKYDVKNCDSALSDLQEPVATNFKVKQKISIADQATPVASGTTYQISATEKESLANLVEDAYQQIYQAAQADLEKQEFVAPKDRIANYSIRWDAQVYKSTLLYDFKGEAHSVEYQYTLTIPVVGESTIAICGG